MYTDIDFKTKKELMQAVRGGRVVTVYNPGPFGTPPDNGVVSVEGPHFPKPHRWYARVRIMDGKVVEVQ